MTIRQALFAGLIVGLALGNCGCGDSYPIRPQTFYLEPGSIILLTGTDWDGTGHATCPVLLNDDTQVDLPVGLAARVITDGPASLAHVTHRGVWATLIEGPDAGTAVRVIRFRCVKAKESK